MATNAFANVQGTVFTVEHKEGVGKDSGKPFAMDIVTVLVPGGGLTEVVLPNVIPTDALNALVGEPVDFLIEVYRSAKGFGITVKRNDPLVESYSQNAKAAA